MFGSEYENNCQAHEIASADPLGDSTKILSQIEDRLQSFDNQTDAHVFKKDRETNKHSPNQR
jgi:hypothetical protein